MVMKPPVADRLAYQRQLHGLSWTDYYHWMRAENWQECVDDPSLLPEPIKNYLTAENHWFEHVMSDTSDLQAALVKEMRSRIQDVDQSLPDEYRQWCYVERYEEGDEYARYYRYSRDGVDAYAGENLRVSASEGTSASAGASSSSSAGAGAGASASASVSVSDDTSVDNQQLLINFNDEAAEHEYFDTGLCVESPDHAYLAWSADTQGSERYTLRLRNLISGKDEDMIENTYDADWAGSHFIFYTKTDDEYRPNRVYRHRLGTEASDDVLVYEEKDPRFFCSVWTCSSEQYVFIGADMNDQSEVWYIPMSDITAMPSLIEARAEGVEYTVEHQGDQFLILTNADEAKDFKMVTAPCASPDRTHWRDWLPHRPGIMLLDLYACKNWVMWMEREEALPRICFCHINESADACRRLDFDQEAYALSLEPLAEFDQESFRFSVESPSVPARTYRFDMPTGKRTLLKEDIIPSGHDANDYCVRRLSANALDDETIPVTLLYHKDTALDGTAPCLLTAYGAYGSSEPASFSSTRLSLVNRGFVFAIAHVRGGQEKGRAWYEAARGVHKHNTFDDVVCVAHHLIEQRFTGRERIVLHGASAGGLMVGAVLNRTEDLWAGAIADVPFVDALNTLIDESLPLTPGEWSQWGNPLSNKASFDVIKNYSPYDNVQPRPYPAMMVTAGISDPRVTYWEPAKWVAQHRNQRDDENLLILKTHMTTGHFGASGRYASLEDEALAQAFALKVAVSAKLIERY